MLNTEALMGHVGEFQKGMDVFAGENRARALRYQGTLAEIGGQNQAASDIFAGQVAEANARSAALGSLLGGFGGLADRIGGGRRNPYGYGRFGNEGDRFGDAEFEGGQNLFGFNF